MKPIKLIITGATGTAGSEVLRQALVHPRVAEIAVLTRRELPPHVHPPGDTNPKLRVMIHNDFTTYSPDLLNTLKGYDACIWAQGISAIGMKEPEYKVITHDYPLAGARAFATLSQDGKPFTFLYMSGEGTVQNGKSSQLFARVKGLAEVALARLPSELTSIQTYSFRPAGIIPVQPIPEAMLFARAMTFMAPIFAPLAPKLLISTPDLANGMIEAAVRASNGVLSDKWPTKGQLGDQNVFSSEEIKILAREGGFTTKY